MTQRWLTVLAGLTSVLVLGIVGIHGTNLASRVSEDALAGAQSTLAGSGATWIHAEADGLKITLSGNAPSEDAYEAGLRAIAALRATRAPQLSLGVAIAAPALQHINSSEEMHVVPARTDVPSEVGIQSEPVRADTPVIEDCPASVLNAVSGAIFYFSEGSALIRTEDIGRLSMLAGQLLRCPQIDIALTGHSDATGERELNYALSLKRAAAVAERLVLSGVASNRLRILGTGADFPVASNRTLDGRQLNRRVTLTIENSGAAGARPNNEAPKQ